MSVIEDVRKVIQDLVAPELKSIAVEVASANRESKLRDEALAARIESAEKESRLRDEMLAREAKSRDELTHAKLEALSAKMEAQYASIIFNLNLDKRVDALERDKQTASA